MLFQNFSLIIGHMIKIENFLFEVGESVCPKGITLLDYF